MKLKIISWNVRGRGETNKIRLVKLVLILHKLDVVCLEETTLRDINNQVLRSSGVGRSLS